MAKDLGDMDKGELREELKHAKARVKEIEKAIGDYDERRRETARAELERIAREKFDVSAEELWGGKSGSGRGRRGAGRRGGGEAKYRHPENPEITWTGRGRKPAWFKEHEEKGGDPKALAV